MNNRYTLTIIVFLFNANFTSFLYGAEYKLVPIESDGPHGIIDQEIRLVGGGQRVILELKISGWDPELDGDPRLRGWQVTIDSCGYSRLGSLCNGGTRNGLCCIVDSQCGNDAFCENPGIIILPAFEACSLDSECDPSFAPAAPCAHVCIGGDNNGVGCTLNTDCPNGVCSAGFCKAGFIDIDRADYIFFGLTPAIAAVSIPTLNYLFGGALFFDNVADNGTEYYGGTLVLDVPLGAIGSYTIGMLTDSSKSFMTDSNSSRITPLNFVSTIITVVCESNIDCDDGSECTTDTCEAGGTCLNENNFDNTTFCCNPSNGVLVTLDDDNECTDNICNTDGSVDHPPLPEFLACGNTASSDCDKADSCDGAGNCLSRLELLGTTCGDPTITDCNDQDTCDGNGICLANLVNAGTLCGDGSNTQCDNPDTCNDQGSCLSNHESDGTICDDGLFCTVDDACFSGQCTDNTPKNCDDGLSCTTDICNDVSNQCDNTLDAGFCLIDNICYADGDLDPSNDCMDCNPSVSTSTWTPRVNGSVCDDGDPCTGTGRPGIGVDTCTDGVCAGITDTECNDDCAFAIEAHEGTTLSNNSSAGADDGEASCQLDSNNDIWFIYTAPCTATIFLSTTGTVMIPSNDPVLNVYNACPGIGGIELACDDDSGVNLQAALVFDATIGLSYLIRVAGFEDNAGAIALNIDLVNDCLIDGVCYAGGGLNPKSSCEECNPDISTMSWTPLAEGSRCGSGDTTECNNPDACDGQGVCEANHKPDGTECSDEGIECTMNFCIAGVCSHPPEAIGFSCGDLTDTECDNPDSCDGTGICLDNFEDAGFTCGDPTSTQCNLFDICSGDGLCTDNLAPDGTKCDDSDVCTGNDDCDTGFCFGTAIPEAPIVNGFGPRNISVTPLPVGSPAPISLRITSPNWPCLDKFIGSDGSFSTVPVIQLPADWGKILLHDPNVVPDTTYQIEATCGEFTSNIGSGTTSVWGDLDNNGITQIDDVTFMVNAWLGLYQLRFEVFDINPCILDNSINIDDVVVEVNAWLGSPFPCDSPCIP